MRGGLTPPWCVTAPWREASAHRRLPALDGAIMARFRLREKCRKGSAVDKPQPAGLLVCQKTAILTSDQRASCGSRHSGA